MLAIQMCSSLPVKARLLIIKYLFSKRYKDRNSGEVDNPGYALDDSFISDHSFWGDTSMDALTKYAFFENADVILTLKIAKNGTNQDGKRVTKL